MIKHPLLRYHGSKWRIAQWIISHFPRHRIYLDPFGGSAAVLLNKGRSEVEIYNDLDGELVNLFQVVRDNGTALAEKVCLTPYSRDEFIKAFEPSSDPLEQARRTMVKSFLGFGGGYIAGGLGSKCAVSEHGFRNSWRIIGNHANLDWLKVPDNIQSTITRLLGVVLENLPYQTLIEKNDTPETLIYADPPYLSTVRDRGTDYRHEFTEQDHIELARMLHHAKGPVILSGYHSALYNDLYKGWAVYEHKTRTMQNSPRLEVIWVKGVENGLFNFD
jgi:DNA adenine methylase